MPTLLRRGFLDSRPRLGEGVTFFRGNGGLGRDLAIGIDFEPALTGMAVWVTSAGVWLKL
jgi:hypothetical protein